MPSDKKPNATEALGLPGFRPLGATEPPPEGPDPATGIVTWGRLAAVLGAFTGVLALAFAIFLFFEGRYASAEAVSQLRVDLRDVRAQLLEVAVKVGAKVLPPASQP